MITSGDNEELVPMINATNFFITSKEKLQFLNEYTTIEDLKRHYMKTKNRIWI